MARLGPVALLVNKFFQSVSGASQRVAGSFRSSARRDSSLRQAICSRCTSRSSISQIHKKLPTPVPSSHSQHRASAAVSTFRESMSSMAVMSTDVHRAVHGVLIPSKSVIVAKCTVIAERHSKPFWAAIGLGVSEYPCFVDFRLVRRFRRSCDQFVVNSCVDLVQRDRFLA